ncbi:DUF411 domain-containing protein, partial [bacterium]|nr:DUF411 domain-containing protein [bacterium]
MTHTSINLMRRSLSMGLMLIPFLSHAAANKPLITVWKSPSCGCCKDWIAYIEKNGFSTKVISDGNDEIRKKMGMPIQFGSCHTAVIDGYAIEGHVPVREIKRMLAEKPNAVGIAVPAMPIGSPGMDGPEYGSRRDSYNV